MLKSLRLILGNSIEYLLGHTIQCLFFCITTFWPQTWTERLLILNGTWNTPSIKFPYLVKKCNLETSKLFEVHIDEPEGNLTRDALQELLKIPAVCQRQGVRVVLHLDAHLWRRLLSDRHNQTVWLNLCLQNQVQLDLKSWIIWASERYKLLLNKYNMFSCLIVKIYIYILIIHTKYKC